MPYYQHVKILLLFLNSYTLALYYPCTTQIGSNGICTTPDECLNNKFTTKRGFDCPNGRICCPKVSRQTEVNLRHDHICPSQIKTEDYTNNELVKQSQYPWIVILRYHNIVKNQHFYGCIGNVISSSLVLTSAHCITGLEIGVKLISIRMGVRNLTINCSFETENVEECSKIQDFQVLYAWYPNENKFSYTKNEKHDIGFVVIKGQVIYTNDVMPICLLSVPIKTEDAKLIISGWENSLRETNGFLQQKTVKKVNHLLCENTFNRNLNDQNQICIEENCVNHDDSSSVLHVIRDGKIFVYGVFSYGQKECQNGVTYKVFTIVQPYIGLMQESANERGVIDFPLTFLMIT